MKESIISKSKCLELCLAAVLFVLFFLAVFARFLSGSQVLMSSDAVISYANKTALEVVVGMFANWNGSILMGIPSGDATHVVGFLQAFFRSGILWNNLVYGLACLMACFAWRALFISRGVKRNAILIGALAAFWLSSNFTLIYAGHGLKPYVVLFFICSLLVKDVSSLRGGILWGSCVGLMFVQQADMAMLFAMFAGAYLLFRLWQAKGAPASWPRACDWLKVLVPAAVVALLFAAGPLLSGYKHNVKDTEQVQAESPKARWNYITQWSMPPEEMIDFIAPNYTGIRSGDPDGPYWGRMGRSEGWETHHQGFMNYRMESLYLGIIPIGFALFAIFSCKRSKHRAEIIFWAVATLVALLLSFGKYFPLYALFYQLPVVNNIRNPNKFLQIFQVALAILTVYGVDALFRERERAEGKEQRAESQKEGMGKTEDRRRKTENEVGGQRSEVRKKTSDIRSPTSDLRPPSPALRWFFWGLTVFTGILLLAAVALTLDWAGCIDRVAAGGWPRQAAQVIVNNKIYALWHAVLMAAVMIAVFAIFNFKPLEKLLRFRSWIAAALVLIVAFDAVKLSRDYVKEMPRSYIDANPLTEFLKTNLGYDRVALVQQQGIYNIWLTYLLPYNRIPTFNFTAMPRMPIDYKQFLEAGSKDPLRMWQFSAVKYLLAPTELEKQIPSTVASKVFSYHLAQAAGDNVRVVPAPDGVHAVFELKDALPRYALVADYQDESQAALVRLSDRTKPLVNGRLINDGVQVLSYRPGRVELKTQSAGPAMLRAAERWDADWVATVDGETVEVQRIDFLCQGVEVPAGEHHVILAYTPSKLFFYMQMLGCAVLFITIIASLVMRRNGGLFCNKAQIQVS